MPSKPRLALPGRGRSARGSRAVRFHCCGGGERGARRGRVEAQDRVEGERVVGVVALGRDVERTVGADGEALGVGLADAAGEEDLLAGAPVRWRCRAPTGRPASRGGTPSSCSSRPTARPGSWGRTRGRSCRDPRARSWSSRRTPDRPPSPTRRPATPVHPPVAGPVPDAASGWHGTCSGCRCRCRRRS